MEKNNISFEEALKRLDEIANILEGENLLLDDSLKLYEEGIALVRYCNSMIENAERKIKALNINSDGEPEEKDFFLSVEE